MGCTMLGWQTMGDLGPSVGRLPGNALLYTPFAIRLVMCWIPTSRWRSCRAFGRRNLHGGMPYHTCTAPGSAMALARHTCSTRLTDGICRRPYVTRAVVRPVRTGGRTLPGRRWRAGGGSPVAGDRGDAAGRRGSALVHRKHDGPHPEGQWSPRDGVADLAVHDSAITQALQLKKRRQKARRSRN